ncbi:response regulator [Flavobacterium pallidum]|uniref:Response regulatory domain-containing protein n=1 Tax=Flavobacterium pallidum TaxID=2172098 RepID=A0A2S1SK49_9FLAO|nr:response regulator [Flavobacterium pallidum]AWI26788.1 hypothetical protein HYN49_13270 [Flavobacterium pallidum]
MKILMIDDHPSQLHAYKMILSLNEQNLAIETTEVYTCEAAYPLIVNASPNTFSFVFLDRSMPAYKEKNINSGEDLAAIIRLYHPGTKLVMLTSHAESFIIYNIVRNINPDGLLVKSDFGTDELLDAFTAILNGSRYHSQTVRSCMDELLLKEDYLDSYDREIVTLLGEGAKMKTMMQRLNLSRSAIDKRKAQIKIYLEIEKGDDEAIVRKAREAGLI